MFEKENIYTLDSKGELLVTLMSSLAQEESRSISENVTWGQRRRFAEGKINLPYKRFLGYKKGADGLPEIIPEEAEIVRYIYKSYITGCTTYAIAKDLTSRKIPTPDGKTKWKWAKDVRPALSLWHRKPLEEQQDGCPTLYPKVIVSLPKAVSTTVNGSHINMTEDTIST